MKNKMGWDDALDVWGVHGVGGFLGIVMLGIFANKEFNPNGANGLLYGDPTFLLKQVTAVVFSSVWAFVFTYGMLRIIDAFTPVKVTEISEAIGLDESIHGEHAYEEAPEHERPLSRGSALVRRWWRDRRLPRQAGRRRPALHQQTGLWIDMGF